MASSDDQEKIPLPRFERDEFKDRGYYLVCEFQDEKRRRDRAKAVRTARRHPGYVCLMTPDNRLLHRTFYTREQVPRFLELQDLISTWTSPRFYVMGYPIDAKNVLRGLECFERMGETCNPLVSSDDHEYSSYFGCPRGSISLKYMHPKVWYTVFYRQDPENKKRYLLIDDLEEIIANEVDDDDDDDDDDDSNRPTDIGELRRISRRYCGCPLIQLRRAQSLYRNLPEVIEVGEDWRIAPDMMGEPSIQPRNKATYHEILERLELGTLPCSDRPQSRPEDDDDEDEEIDEKLDPAEARRRQLQKYSWLE